MPAVERDRRAAQLRTWMAAGALGELERLADAPLAAAQLGQPGDRVAGVRRSRALEVRDRRDELGVGARPVAAPELHGGVVGAADAEQEGAVVAAGEPGHAIAPLARALEVADALACRNEKAARPALGDRQPRLAGERAGGRLVEAAHAVADLGQRDERRPLERQPEHLEVGDAEAPTELRGRRGERPRGGVISGRRGQVGLVEREPAVLLAGLAALDKARGPREPAAGGRALAAEVEVVAGEPDRDPRGAGVVAVVAVAPVGALTGGERRVGVVEPPRRPAEALQRLGMLVGAQRRLELRSRIGPAPLPESGPAGCAGIDRAVAHRRCILPAAYATNRASPYRRPAAPTSLHRFRFRDERASRTSSRVSRGTGPTAPQRFAAAATPTRSPTRRTTPSRPLPPRTCPSDT
ncbi:MAG TPA: hypothetical protein VG474_02620 [Solirubrobacteraceae bacterium]|nr:hypothetical protein [Solirubrobacteraceae bacterium]